jgi:L-histidine Nalpha-methyltransferase
VTDNAALGIGAVESTETFAADVRYYFSLTPRQLPSKYLYDALGSALFEAITDLPWYSLKRAEMRLLDAHARDVFRAADPLETIVELGPGSGDKLARLIEGAGPPHAPLDVRLIDVSSSALDAAARRISAVDGAEVTAYRQNYDAGLDRFRSERRRSGRTLVVFLGSNIGNFDPPGGAALLRAIRAALLPSDTLLVGTDLVKPDGDLIRAYDDPLGVTAAFNLNLLVRINRELDGNFDVTGFRHRAVWNGRASRVEMHLVSRRPQRVHIQRAGIDVVIAKDESIWTESSYKYQPSGVMRLLEQAGFRTVAQWIDAPDAFALTLAEAAAIG